MYEIAGMYETARSPRSETNRVADIYQEKMDKRKKGPHREA
jgi:ssDNA-binding replication factor A large subunit